MAYDAIFSRKRPIRTRDMPSMGQLPLIKPEMPATEQQPMLPLSPQPIPPQPVIGGKGTPMEFTEQQQGRSDMRQSLADILDKRLQGRSRNRPMPYQM